MPLQEGSSRAVIEANIAELIRSGYPRKQAVAIAFEHAARGRKKEKDREHVDRSRR